MRIVLLALVSAVAFAQSSDVAALRNQAAQARDRNQASEAIRLYRECVHRQPGWTEGWWYLGTLLYDQSSFAPAREALAKVVLLEPQSPPAAWALLGLAEFETKNYQDSLQHLDRSFIGDSPSDPFGRAARYHAALLLTRSGQFEAALKRLAQISVPEAQTPEVTRAIGVAALRMPIFASDTPPAQQGIVDAVGAAMFDSFVRRERDAEAKFQELLKKYPERAELHHIHCVLLLTSDPEAAIRECRREIEISPRHVPARLQIAFELLKQGDGTKALPYAREALALDPGSFAAHNALGQAFAETGDLKRAIVELEKAVALAPDSAETHMSLASAYAKAGRAQDATREHEIFRKLRKLRESGPGDNK